ncbi:unnamed protein product [Ixodes persulcatus]
MIRNWSYAKTKGKQFNFFPRATETYQFCFRGVYTYSVISKPIHYSYGIFLHVQDSMFDTSMTRKKQSVICIMQYVTRNHLRKVINIYIKSKRGSHGTLWDSRMKFGFCALNFSNRHKVKTCAHKFLSKRAKGPLNPR